MSKFSNVLKAAGVMMGLVWGIYGNKDASAQVPVTTTQVPVITTVSEPAVPGAARAEITVQQTDYPTVMKRVTVDLTDKPSRTRSVSAPFKSDGIDVPAP